MTAFTFSIEQLRAAPPEVQRWVASEIARALGAVGGQRPEAPQGGARQPQPMALAACSVPEAARVFELIGNDAVVARLFFELGRESTLSTSMPGLHAMRVADLLHHSGLSGQDALFDGLGAIDRAFRQVHGDHGGSLFGFDEAGHLYIQEMTQASIRRIWEELVQARAAAERESALEAAPRFEGFVPPRVGPSEDIAAHAGRPPAGTDLPF